MTKKNIILTSILLVIFAIIIGIGLDIVKAQNLVGHLQHRSTNLVAKLGRLDQLKLDRLNRLETKSLNLDTLNDNTSLHAKVLKSNARLLDASKQLNHV